MLNKKKCNVCKVVLERGVNWGKSSNLLCTEHYSKYTQEKYYRHRDKYLTKVKKYFQTEKGKSARRKASKIARANYPEKWETRHKARLAVAKGDMARLACQVCGNFLAEMHHEDYSKPLDVVWLCKKHHIEADKMRINYLSL